MKDRINHANTKSKTYMDTILRIQTYCKTQIIEASVTFVCKNPCKKNLNVPIRIQFYVQRSFAILNLFVIEFGWTGVRF